MDLTSSLVPDLGNSFVAFEDSSEFSDLVSLSTADLRLFLFDFLNSPKKYLLRPFSLLSDIDTEVFFDDSLNTVTSVRNVFTDDLVKKVMSGDFITNPLVEHRYAISSSVMLPMLTPIHLICGSKDVIHSWAIPGLLVKIDCIPGYNSHRRLFIK